MAKITGPGAITAKEIMTYIKTGKHEGRSALCVMDDTLVSQHRYWRWADIPIVIPADMVMPDNAIAPVFLINDMYWGSTSTKRSRVHAHAARMAAESLEMDPVDCAVVSYQGQRYRVYTTPKS